MPDRALKVPYAQEIEAFAQAAVKNLGANSVVLYGSMARGDYNEASDIDIVVIADALPRDFLKRLELLQGLNKSRQPIEALGYTREEFAQMLERRHVTALYAVADGKVLYDDGLFAKMRRRFRQLSEEIGLERVENGWIAHKIFDENIKHLKEKDWAKRRT